MLSDAQLRRAAFMWKYGFGTSHIAKTLRVYERRVYNNLERVKELARKMHRKEAS